MVLAERRRIALDLHDSVAHGVTAMLLHVGAVRQVLGPSEHRDAARSAPPSVQVVGFRVAQEGLTNVLRHATARKSFVEVDLDGPVMSVDVTDDGQALHQPRVVGSGRGLAGLRERVAVFGGTLEAGPGTGGGWAVRARIPTGVAS